MQGIQLAVWGETVVDSWTLKLGEMGRGPPFWKAHSLGSGECGQAPFLSLFQLLMGVRYRVSSVSWRAWKPYPRSQLCS